MDGVTCEVCGLKLARTGSCPPTEIMCSSCAIWAQGILIRLGLDLNWLREVST